MKARSYLSIAAATAATAKSQGNFGYRAHQVAAAAARPFDSANAAQG
jgi:hypothetical protein